jgi:hypothetical protein
MAEVEVWVMVNESGEYEVGVCDTSCKENFEANCSTGEMNKMFKLTLKVPLPKPQELTAEIPEEEDEPVELEVK